MNIVGRLGLSRRFLRGVRPHCGPVLQGRWLRVAVLSRASRRTVVADTAVASASCTATVRVSGVWLTLVQPCLRRPPLPVSNCSPQCHALRSNNRCVAASLLRAKSSRFAGALPSHSGQAPCRHRRLLCGPVLPCPGIAPRPTRQSTRTLRDEAAQRRLLLRYAS